MSQMNDANQLNSRVLLWNFVASVQVNKQETDAKSVPKRLVNSIKKHRIQSEANSLGT